MNVEIVHASIESFLRQRIDKKIEDERKKLKDDFTTEHLSKIYSDHEIVSWMNYIADNASKVSLNVSHVAKLTHSSNKAINLVDSIQQEKYPYLLTTQTANIPALDIAYTDASYAPVAEFLGFRVENTEKDLGQFLAENELYFSKISDQVNIRKSWQTKIAEAYSAKKLSSHVLAKQVYIPISQAQYHVISPVKSSALAHKVFEIISQSRSKNNPINLARKQNITHEGVYIRFSKPAFLSVTKSNHQNASKLNSTRRGGLYFFQALPPQWKTNVLPPKNAKQFLARCKNTDSIEVFKEIKDLLFVLKKENLTINLNRKNILGEKVVSIADEVIHQILFIEQSYIEGWSKQFDVEAYLRAFLDPTQIGDISKNENKNYVDEFTEQVAKWISQNVGDKYESRQLKAIWFSYLQPIFNDFYKILQAEE